MIPFNRPLITGKELEYIRRCISQDKFCGDGSFTGQCVELLRKLTNAKKVLFTTSCTHAMEMAALLIDIQPGDEVIMPSFTFVSTANPFVLRGAKIAFVDVRPDTMNIDEKKIDEAITSKTKAIVPVHYAGVGCEMDAIMDLADKHNLFVIEDAAQGIMASYKEKALGTIGHLGCYSFHKTKNIQCGEGGALLINDERFLKRAETISEKGTNRAAFLRGEIDKYSWVDIGCNCLLSELNAAFLLAQIEQVKEITAKRQAIWQQYYEMLEPIADSGKIEVPYVPEHCSHNGHIFYIKLKDIDERQKLIDHLKQYDIYGVFHYVPLHSSGAGRKFGYFSGEDIYTTRDSDRLLRLPLYYELHEDQVSLICEKIKAFLS